MHSRRSALAAVVLTLLMGTAAVSGHAADTGSDTAAPQDRLTVLEAQALDKMRELSAARHSGDADEAERLQKEFDAIQKERAELLQETGQLPPRRRSGQ